MPPALILLIGIAAGVTIGLAIGIAIGVRQHSHPVSPSPIDRTPIAFDAHTRHDLHAPLKMILGYCDLWLKPSPNRRVTLPIALRDDLASIARNAEHAQTLIDQLLINGTESDKTDPLLDSPSLPAERGTGDEVSASAIAVFHSDPLVAERLMRYLPDVQVIPVSTLAELASGAVDLSMLRLIVTAPDEPNLAGLVTLTGNQIPILSGILPGTAHAAAITHRIRYLAKPVTYERLVPLLAGIASPARPVRSILIIDDHQDSVAMLDRLLIEIDPHYRIGKAYSGREGLALLQEQMQEQAPDLVILDISLPDLDGLTLVHIMQMIPRLAEIPVLLISAYGESDRPIDLVLPIRLSLMKADGFTPDELRALMKTLIKIIKLQQK